MGHYEQPFLSLWLVHMPITLHCVNLSNINLNISSSRIHPIARILAGGNYPYRMGDKEDKVRYQYLEIPINQLHINITITGHTNMDGLLLALGMGYFFHFCSR